MERAKKLLESAEHLYQKGDLAGVAGLSYAAFESAVISLTEKMNGKDYPSHHLRKKRAKELINKYQHQMDLIWEIRNIDFYGNIKIGSRKREISSEEVKDALESVKKIIIEIDKINK